MPKARLEFVAQLFDRYFDEKGNLLGSYNAQLINVVLNAEKKF